MQEFPKLMWAPDGVEVTVRSQAEQDEKLAAGFSLTAPGTPVAAEELPGTGDTPTFGAPDDDTYNHAKRSTSAHGGAKKK